MLPFPRPEDEKPELVDSITEIHHEVANLLGGPPAVRIGRRTENVDVAAANLQDEEHSSLEFVSTTAGGFGPVIDDVQVQPCLLILCL